MRLACALGPELYEVVVALDERDKADQLEQLGAAPKHLWVESDRLNQQIDPLISGELCPCMTR